MQFLERIFEENKETLDNLRIHKWAGPLLPFRREDGSLYLRLEDNTSFEHIDSKRGNYMYYRYNGDILYEKLLGRRLAKTPVTLVVSILDCKNTRGIVDVFTKMLQPYVSDISIEINKQEVFLEETSTEVIGQKNERILFSFSFIVKDWVNFCEPPITNCLNFNTDIEYSAVGTPDSIEKVEFIKFVNSNATNFTKLGITKFYGVLMPYKREDGTYYLRSMSGQNLDHINSKGNYMYIRYDGKLEQEGRTTLVPLTLVVVTDNTNVYQLANYLLQRLDNSYIIEGDVTTKLNKQEVFVQETNSSVDKQKSEKTLLSFSFTAKLYSTICPVDLVCSECLDEELEVRVM